MRRQNCLDQANLPTERRRNRTFQAWGCHALLVLKITMVSRIPGGLQPSLLAPSGSRTKAAIWRFLPDAHCLDRLRPVRPEEGVDPHELSATKCVADRSPLLEPNAAGNALARVTGNDSEPIVIFLDHFFHLGAPVPRRTPTTPPWTCVQRARHRGVHRALRSEYRVELSDDSARGRRLITGTMVCGSTFKIWRMPGETSFAPSPRHTSTSAGRRSCSMCCADADGKAVRRSRCRSLPWRGGARRRDGLCVYWKAYFHRKDALRDLGVPEDALKPIAP